MNIHWKGMALMLALSTRVAASAPDAAEKEIEADIRSEFARWAEAYKNHDLPGTMRIFDPQVRFAFQGSPDVGYAELESSYVAEFKATSTARWVGNIDEVQASGSVAAEFSTWKLVDIRGGQEIVLALNRGMDLFRLNTRGEWRIVRSLNYPVNPPKAPAK